MTMFTMLVFGLLAVQDTADSSRPLSVGEKWYQESSVPEKEFEGRLDFNPGDGKIGLPERYCAFRIIGVDEGKPVSRPLYLDGKDHLLAGYVGRRVRLHGKLIEREADGKKLFEFWPGKLLAVTGEAGDSIGEVKILARTNNLILNTGRTQFQPKVHVVRDAATLSALSGIAGPGAEQIATSRLATFLNVTSIDWNKQMVVIVAGGIRPSGGAKVEITRLNLDEKGLDVHWKLSNQVGGVGLAPTETVLVPRFDAEIRFHQEGVKQPIIVEAVGGPAKPK